MRTKDKVIGSEDLSKWSRPHRVHGSRLQVHQHSTGHIFATCVTIKKNVLIGLAYVQMAFNHSNKHQSHILQLLTSQFYNGTQ